MIIGYEENEKLIIKALASGEVVAVPTDTVYGLCCNAFCPTAIKKIYFIKNRPEKQPLAMVIKDVNSLFLYSQPANIIQRRYVDCLTEHFLPGELTMLLDSNGTILDQHLIKNGKIAFRVVDTKPLSDIFSIINFPLALTSANKHGYNNCQTAEQVKQQLGEEVRYIIDYPEKVCLGVVSTIIHFSEKNEIIIDREGAIKEETIRKCISTINNL